jgi:hypothetical protein
VGRVLFNRVLPEQVHFVNEKLDKAAVKDIGLKDATTVSP